MSEGKDTAMTAGKKVLVHGSPATVLAVHSGGKRLAVLYDTGKATFVSASAAKAA